MRQTWLTGIVMSGLVAAAAWALAERSGAQAAKSTATGRIACVNVVVVFNGFQRQKDLTEEMNQLQARLQEENKQRRDKIDALQAELERLNPDDPTYMQRTRDMLAQQIDYKNWVDLRQADLTREVGLWSIKIYREILKATEALAEKEGYDLVLYKGEFEPTSMDPDTVKDLIRANHVLYAHSSIDVTQAVLDKLNNDYRAQPRPKMMYVP